VIRTIYVYGSPVLRQMCHDIQPDYPDLQQLLVDMWETMRKSDGVGLAAPQIGLPIRLFVIDASSFADQQPELAGFQRTFINAHILERFDGEYAFNEGCLSLPGVHEDVRRPASIRMQWLDEEFVPHEEVFTGITARIIQHEYDHIDGRLFIDLISPMRRRMLQGKLKNMSRGRFSASYPCRVG